jgi:hypothetical protein
LQPLSKQKRGGGSIKLSRGCKKKDWKKSRKNFSKSLGSLKTKVTFAAAKRKKFIDTKWEGRLRF